MRLTLQEIVQATRGTVGAGPDAREPAPVITGVSTDTRTLHAGDLFVPLRGPRADGHDFIADAFRRGAAAALSARPTDGLPAGALLIRVDDPLRALGRIAHAYRRTLTATVVGVTGSVGKTTTTKLCVSVLSRRFTVAATKEEWNAEIGVPLALLDLTPQHQVAVVEMAMRGLGQIAELVAIAQPEIGVVTTIGESHLELLGTIETVARAKGELIEGLPAHGVAVLNADDPPVAGLARVSKGRVVTYGLTDGADARGTDVTFTPTGMRFRLRWQGRDTDVALPAWGRHNVRNALAAAAVGLVMGLDPQEAGEGLARYHPPKMRLQPVPSGDVLIINDAYNASPASMEAAFEVLEEVGRGRRTVAILGEMRELGADAVRMHRAVGASLARRPVSLLVTVAAGGDPIAAGATAAGMDPLSIVRLASVDEAAARLPALIRSGDVVLVKGSRALEMERIVAALVQVRAR